MSTILHELQLVWVIALNTFRESIRSKALYTVMVFAVVICAVASLIGKVTIGDQSLVVVTFGLFCCSLFSVLYVIFSGASLFSKEITRRTIITVLAKPISRYQLIIGKWLGLVITSAILTLLMILALSLYTGLLFKFNPLALFQSAVFILLELGMIAALILLFSSIVVTPMFVGIFTFALFLAGRSASYIFQLTETVSNSGLRALTKIAYGAVPKFEYLNMSDRLLAGEVLTFEVYYSCFSYALGYSILVLLISSVCLQRREFH